MSKKGAILVIAIFLLSVLIRLPNLNRPLSKHHEFCTAVALQVITIWDEAGARNYHYAPSLTYPGDVNKGINNWASPNGNLVDENGRYYYLSHPPLAYFIPYVIFKSLAVEPSVIGLQLLSLLAHFLSALGVFLIVRQFTNRFYLSILGFTVYLFTPSALWFQGNVYMSDMLVMPFYIYTVYFLLRYVQHRSGFGLGIYAILLALTLYTSWLGAFLAFFVVLFGLTRRNRNMQLVVTTAVTVLVVLIGIYLHYASIAGGKNLIDQLGHRLAQRSVNNSGSGLLEFGHMVWLVIYNHLTGYGLLFLLVLVGIGIKFKALKNDLRFKQMLWPALFPLLLLNGILLNYAGHDFVALYSGLFLSLTAVLIIENTNLSNRSIILSIAILSLVQVFTYYYINRPGVISQSGERYDHYLKQATQIRENATKDQLILIKDLKPEPQAIYYLGQNVLTVEGIGEARDSVKQRSEKKAVYLEFDSNNKVVNRTVLP